MSKLARIILLIPWFLLIASQAFSQTIQGWNPIGGSVPLAVSSTSANVALPVTGASPPPPNAKVCNTGAQPAYIAFGNSNVTAYTTTSGAQLAGSYLTYGICQLFAIPNNAGYIAAITSTSSTTLEIEVGSGNLQSSGPGGSASKYLPVIPGADPSGATDSTAALTAWVNANPDAYIPPGTYQVCNLRLPVTAAQYLHGGGADTVLKAGASCNEPVVSATCGTAHTGSTTLNSNVVTSLPTAGMVLNGQLYGTGVPPGATITSIDSGTQVHMSLLATKTGTPVITATAPGQKIELWGMVLNGNSANQTQDGSVPSHGVYLVNCPNVALHDFILNNVAGHGTFFSNPADSANTASAPGGYSKQSVYNSLDVNNGVSRGGTYGSCFAVSNGNKTLFYNDRCDGTKKAGFRVSGLGVQVVDGVVTAAGNAGVGPVAGSTSALSVLGGSYTDSTPYTDTGVTGTASGSTLSSLSADVLTVADGGWQNSDVVTDSGGCLPSSAPYAYISSISTDGLTVTLTGTITGTCAGDTFTTTGAPDGIRNDGASNTTVGGGVTIAGNAGSGIDDLNASPNLTVGSDVSIYDNGQASTYPIGPTDGRDGVKCNNTSTATQGLKVHARFFDDQGTPTQQYHVNLSGGCDSAEIDDAYFDANATLGRIGLLSTGSTIRVGYGNFGLTANHKDDTTNAIGSTSPTTVSTVVITANEISRNALWDFVVSGTIAGTNSTKVLALNNSSTGGNGTTQLFSADAGVTGNFMLTCEISFINQSSLHGGCTGNIGTTPTSTSFATPGNLNMAQTTTFNLVVTDGSASDTFTYRSSSFKRVQ